MALGTCSLPTHVCMSFSVSLSLTLLLPLVLVRLRWKWDAVLLVVMTTALFLGYMYIVHVCPNFASKKGPWVQKMCKWVCTGKGRLIIISACKHSCWYSISVNHHVCLHAYPPLNERKLPSIQIPVKFKDPSPSLNNSCVVIPCPWMNTEHKEIKCADSCTFLSPSCFNHNVWDWE